MSKDFKVGEIWIDNEGDEHEIQRVDMPGTFPLLTYWRTPGEDFCGTGFFDATGEDDGYTLLHPKPDQVRYVNLYPNGASSCFPSRAAADAAALESRIACVRVEFYKGQADD